MYVLTNEAMPDFIKIGITSGNSAADVQTRMRQLDNTSIPLAFNCEYAAVINDYQRVEQALLTAFEDKRVRNREFLQNTAPHRIKALLKLHEICEVTPEQANVDAISSSAESLPRRRAENFRFHMAQVPIGATLSWGDNPEIQCRVINERQVEHEGNTTTISALAKDLKGWPSARGTLYWLYEGETLQERRERLEMEQDDG